MTSGIYPRKLKISKEELFNLYINKRLSILKISKKLKISDPWLYRLLIRYNIPIRKRGEMQKGQIHPFKFKLTKEELYDLYWNKRLNTPQIAKFLNLNCGTVNYWLERYNIKKRTAGESNKGKRSGWIKKICPICKKEFERRKSWNVTFCSYRCANLGENNPMYKKIPWNKSLPKEKQPFYGKHHTEEDLPKMLKKLSERPTSFEQKICDLCLKYKLPFIYSGDGRFLVGYKNPDFRHKHLPILIEVYNDYHHPKDYEEIRGEHFAKYGYKTIFINEQEVTDENWEEICLEKIKNEK